MNIIINLINDNVATNGEYTWVLSNSYDISKFCQDIRNLNIKKFYVVTGPGSYTCSRKSIALSKSLGLYNNSICFYGINILTDYMSLYSSHVAYIHGKLIWIYNKNNLENPYKMDNILNFIPTEHMYTNLYLPNLIDCSTNNLWKHIDVFQNPISSFYLDKFKIY